MQQSANIVEFSCGNSCIVCVDKNGEVFGLGNNEFGQLVLPGEFFSKTFKKIPINNTIGNVKKAICIGDCTFYVSEDDEVFFAGRFSFNSIFFVIQSRTKKLWDKHSLEVRLEIWLAFPVTLEHTMQQMK